MATYEQIDAVNWSTLKELGRSPRHYRHVIATPRKDTPAFALGRATHCAVLEPESFPGRFVAWESARRGAEWEEFRESHERLTILSLAEWDRSRAIADAVLRDPHARELVTGGVSEKILRWSEQVPLDGADPVAVACKGRTDYVITRRRLLVELKTTRVGSPLGFGRECAKYLYHAQLAFYLAGLAAHGKEMSAAIVAVESDPPHVVQVYTVPDDAIECGREEYRALLRRLVQCRAAGEWGGYAEGPTDLVLPRWAYGDDEDAGDLGLDFGTEEAAA